MADPNAPQQPTPDPQDQNPKQDIKPLIEDIEKKKKAEGDYRDILKESIANLKQIAKTYDTIENKLEGLLDDTINIKEAEKILIEAKEKQYRSTKNLQYAEKELDDAGKKRADDYIKSLREVESLEAKQLESRKAISKQTIELSDIQSAMSADSINKADEYLKHVNQQSELAQTKVEYEKELSQILLTIKGIQDGTIAADQQTLTNLLAKKSSAEDLIKIANQDLDLLSKKEDTLKSSLSKEEADLVIKRQQLESSSKLHLEGEKQLASAIELNDIRNNALSTQESAYVAAKKANDIANDGVNFAKKRLAEEKRVKDMTGLTGQFFEILATKIGVGDSVMGAMVKKARELRIEQEKTGKKGFFVDAGNKIKTLGAGVKQVGKNIQQSFSDPAAWAAGFKLAEKGLDFVGDKIREAGKSIAGLSKHTGDTMQNLTSGVSGLIAKIPLIGGLLSGIVDGASAFIDLLLGVDNYIQKTGRSLEKTSGEIKAIRNDMIDVANATGDAFITADRMLDSYNEIANQLGRSNQLTNQQLEQDIKLKEFLEFDLETRAKLVDISNVQGTSQDKIVAGVFGEVKAFQKLTGIQLNGKKIVKELVGLSGVLGLEFAKYPQKMANTLVATKALGLELRKLESMGDKLLDFESSISAEFEAQLLTGKNINLMKARELFLNNDLAGAAAEISSQIGSSEDFLHMNRIQQESISNAIGMSRDEMADMLLKQEQLSRAQRIFGADNVKTVEQMKEKVKTLIEQGDKQKALNILGGQDLLDAQEKATAQEKLANSIEKIKQAFVNMIEKSGIMDKVTHWIDLLTDEKNIKGIIGTVKRGVADFIDFMTTFMAGTMRWAGEWIPGIKKSVAYEKAAAVEAFGTKAAARVRGMGESKAEQAKLEQAAVQKEKAAKIEVLKDQAEGPGVVDYLRVTASALNPLAYISDFALGTNIVGNQFQNLSDKRTEAAAAQQQLKSMNLPEDKDKQRVQALPVKDYIIQKIPESHQENPSQLKSMNVKDYVIQKIPESHQQIQPQVKSMNVKDYVLKSLPEDTIVGAGGTKLGRTDEMVSLLKEIVQGLKSPDSSQSKSQINVNNNIHVDPITGAKIVTQIDQGGGDTSKFLNPVHGRG